MDENTHSDHIHPPANPETDFSGNPTDANPDSGAQWQAESQGASSEGTGAEGAGFQGAGSEGAAGEGAAPEGGRPRAVAGREMLVQLQQMIDTMATQAGPVMREVAAKAAELAAIAGEKAGPLAHRAAGATETLGQRVASRSKGLADELRRPKTAEEQTGTEFPSEGDASSSPESADWPADPPRNADD
jgi:hypothetical protein